MSDHRIKQCSMMLPVLWGVAHCAPSAHVREGNPELPEVAAQLQKDRSRASLSGTSRDRIGSLGTSLVTKTGEQPLGCRGGQ